jgi:hypothetical protein
MSHVRSLLARVARLEREAIRPSPFQLIFGSALEAEVQKQIDAGQLCHLDMPVVLASIRRWEREGVWSMWGQRGQVWNYGGPH